MNKLIVAVEGINGSGKSSTCNRLSLALSDLCISNVVLREVGSTIYGNGIRKSVFGDPDVPRPQSQMGRVMQILSSMEDTTTLIKRLPVEVVILNRWWLSTLVYQKDIITKENLKAVTSIFGIATPDISIILTINYQTYLSRTVGREERLGEVDFTAIDNGYRGIYRDPASHYLPEVHLLGTDSSDPTEDIVRIILGKGVIGYSIDGRRHKEDRKEEE
jgi:thymidylate kinase